MKPNIEITGRKIGPGQPVFIVAELSANHGGSLEHASKVVREAAACGADAMKLQTYTPDTLTIDCDEEPFRVGSGGLWANRQLHDLYREAHTPWEWQPELKKIAEGEGMLFFSTAYDPTSVAFLEEMDVPVYKIASFELVDLPLIELIGNTGRPTIISTGMGTLAEINDAVDTFFSTGNEQLALLKCTSAYPAPPEEMHLRTIPHLADAFGVPVGLSDHTMGASVAVAAVALGACIVEKHFCLSRDEDGPDSTFSMEPAEFRQMVKEIRMTEAARGDVHYGLTEKETGSRVFRRSLFVVKDMVKGEIFTEENMRSIRPGYGLPPKFVKEVLGRRAADDIARGTPLTWDLTS